MDKTEIGDWIVRSRTQAGFKQIALARLAGIQQWRLSQLELGKGLPGPAEWAALRSRLPLLPETLPGEPEKLPPPSSAWRINKPTLSPEDNLSRRLYAARKRFGPAFERDLRVVEAREDAELCLRFLRQSGSDSADELAGLVQLLADGGNPRWFAPTHAGFRALTVLDPTSRLNVSDVRRPCLEISFDGVDWLLFPQVTIDARRCIYRLDALACARQGQQRTWVDIEIDGRGHDPLFDEERRARLGPMTLRFTPQELLSQRFLQTLTEKFKAACPPGVEQAS